jgi:hypothetical protein
VPLLWPLAGILVFLSYRRWPAVAYAICLLGFGLGWILILGGGWPVRRRLPKPPPAAGWRLVGIACAVSMAILAGMIWQHFSVRAELTAAAVAAVGVFLPVLVVNRRYRDYSFFNPPAPPP